MIQSMMYMDVSEEKIENISPTQFFYISIKVSFYAFINIFVRSSSLNLYCFKPNYKTKKIFNNRVYISKKALKSHNSV